MATVRGQGAQPGPPLLLQTSSHEEGSRERAGPVAAAKDHAGRPPGLSSATVSSSDLAGDRIVPSSR